jgi:hypothetical protein
MKCLFLLLFNFALASSNLSLNENNISIHKVVQSKSFEIGIDVPMLTFCDIKKDNYDKLQRCTYKSWDIEFKGLCPRVQCTGNEYRCQFSINNIQINGN